MKNFKKLFVMAVVTTFMVAMNAVLCMGSTVVNVPVKNTGNEPAKSFNIGYTQEQVLAVDDYKAGVIVPVSIKKAGLVEINVNISMLQDTMYVKLCTDAGCSNYIEYESFSVGETQGKIYANVSNGGIYYLQLYSYKYSDSIYNNSATISIAEYVNVDRTIKSGQVMTIGTSKYNETFYFKYKATKTGAVSFFSNTTEYGKVTLTNAKKKDISYGEYLDRDNGYTFTFAVKKGKTYYFKFVPGSSSVKLHQVYVKYRMAVKEKSGSKKSKAVTIKKKKKKLGTVLPGEKKADWYKFKVTKKKKIKITIQSNITGTLKFEVFDKKGNRIGSCWSNGGTEQLVSAGISKKTSKGTYYIKVSRYDTLSSGVYSIKWK